MSDMVQPDSKATGNTHCSADDYGRLYQESIANPDAFWAKQAERLDCLKAPSKIANWSYDLGFIHVGGIFLFICCLFHMTHFFI